MNERIQKIRELISQLKQIRDKIIRTNNLSTLTPEETSFLESQNILKDSVKKKILSTSRDNI